MNKEIWEKIEKKGEVLFFYDTPQLITYNDYICLAVDNISWIISNPGVYLIGKFKTNQIDLRSLILRGDCKWLVNERTGSSIVLEGDIPEKYLPEDGYFLGI